jgi:hypothetical protein
MPPTTTSPVPPFPEVSLPPPVQCQWDSEFHFQISVKPSSGTSTGHLQIMVAVLGIVALWQLYHGWLSPTHQIPSLTETSSFWPSLLQIGASTETAVVPNLELYLLGIPGSVGEGGLGKRLVALAGWRD